MKKKALITGITGQDGSYLAEFLLGKGYEVHGILRRASTFGATERVDSLHTPLEGEDSKIFMDYGDIGNTGNIPEILHKVKPDEVYNLAAQSHVRISFDIPEYTGDVTGLGTLRMLQAIRNFDKSIKFYQASSSELFGKTSLGILQNEETPFNPQSPYAIAKLYAFYTTNLYRDAYGIFATNGILFNHESPRRGENFVTKKITKNLCGIKRNLVDTLHLGNLDAKRDWGYAKDYVEAMWLMLQQDRPDNYVIATGETHTVREFVQQVCYELDFDLKWRGKGENEVGVDFNTGKEIIKIDPRYFRPMEVDYLQGDASKAREKLKWVPKTGFKELVKLMVEHDLKETDEKINGLGVR